MANPPHLKYESPAESLVDNFSSPGTQYPSLFPDTMDPSQVMTPQSYDDDSMFGDDVGASLDGTPAPEKKQVKKRKSWGQQLPEPKTNLPPRKRAKTEDEKEQRRVERVLRNRRAAQSSRERKRQEVEALEAEKQAIEQRNRDLEMRLADAQAKNALLQRELEQYTGSSGMRAFQGSSAASTPAAEQFRAQSPVTLSQELFSSRDRQRSSISSMTETPQTVNPASLSPEIRPVAESSNASSSDMTQHPAVSVGRTTALDQLSHTYNPLSTLNAQPPHQYNFGGYFDTPAPTDADSHFLEHHLSTLTDSFDLNYDHMAPHNDLVFDDFKFDEFITHQPDDQLATNSFEILAADADADKTANLQPQLGASSYGCDDGGNAVSV